MPFLTQQILKYYKIASPPRGISSQVPPEWVWTMQTSEQTSSLSKVVFRLHVKKKNTTKITFQLYIYI